MAPAQSRSNEASSSAGPHWTTGITVDNRGYMKGSNKGQTTGSTVKGKGRGHFGGGNQDPTQRTAELDEAFNELLSSSRHNAQSFALASKMAQALEDDPVEEIKGREGFKRLSKYLSYLFRFSGLFHEDGSLTLQELPCLPQLTGHLRRNFKSATAGSTANTLEYESFGTFDEDVFRKKVSQSPEDQRMISSVKFLYPLAVTIIHNEKGRFQVGWASKAKLESAGITAEEQRRTRGLICPAKCWQQFSSYETDEIRADFQRGNMIPFSAERIYVRALSGHGRQFTWLKLGDLEQIYRGRNPEVGGYLIHATQSRFWNSIEKEGLFPGGRTRSRRHIHMIPEDFIVDKPTAVRESADLLLFFDPTGITVFNPISTPNGYILIDQDIPESSILGAWSTEDLCWYRIPDQKHINIMMTRGESQLRSTLRKIHSFTYWQRDRYADIDFRQPELGNNVSQLNDAMTAYQMQSNCLEGDQLEHWKNRFTTFRTLDDDDHQVLYRVKTRYIAGEDTGSTVLDQEEDRRVKNVFRAATKNIKEEVENKKGDLVIFSSTGTADPGITGSSSRSRRDVRDKSPYRPRSRTPLVRRKVKTDQSSASTSADARATGSTVEPPPLIDDQKCENCKKPAVGTQVIGSPFTIPGSGYFTDTAEAMYFDVFEPIVLESVILTSNGAGDRKIELWNSKGELLQRATIYVPNGPNQVQVGFTIYPDTGYSLVLASADPGLYVNSTGASYPYNMNGLMELTGSSLGSSAYPFFYFWTVRTLSCFSNRAKVEGIVDTSCVLVGTEELQASNRTFTIYPNPAVEGFQLSGLVDGDRNISLEIFSLEGKLIRRDRFAQASDLEGRSIGAELPPAVYFIKLSLDGEQQQFKWIKTQ